MKILVFGGTGFIGKQLIKEFKDDELIFVSRSRRSGNHRYILGNPQEHVAPEWFNGVDYVINLVGENIFGSRWSPSFKKKLWDSRIESTRNIVNAMKECGSPPKGLWNASAIGFYGSDGVVDDDSSAGTDFLSELCVAWEKEALKAPVRVTCGRIGLVLGKNGGLLERLIPLFRLGLGGPVGTGKQGFSWIHLDDIVRSMRFFMETPSFEGPYILCGPKPVSMNDFAKQLGRVLHRPAFFRAPKFGLKIVLGESAEVVTGGVYAKPEKLLKAGFRFQFEALNDALRDVCS